MESVRSRFSTAPIVLVLMLVMLACVACVFAVQPAWADDGPGGGSQHTFALGLQSEDDYRYGDDILVSGITSGSVSFDPATNTLTIANLSCSSVEVKNSGITVNVIGSNSVWANIVSDASSPILFKGEGTIVGRVDACADATIDGPVIDGSVNCSKDFTMSGGAVTGEVTCGGDFTITAGAVMNGARCVEDFTMSGGVIANVVHCGRNFKMRGGKIDGAVTCKKSFTMSGGSISLANRCDISVGRYYFDDGAPEKAPSMTMTGGTIDIESPEVHGIFLYGANLKMKGGTISITKAHEAPIWAESITKGRRTYGGKVAVTGGSIVAKTSTDGPPAFAIWADSMTNKPACLKAIRGALPQGASFKTGGNVYVVRAGYSFDSVSLVKYGAKKTKAKFGNYVKYGGNAYSISGVGANAFNTSAGKKLKSIAFTGDTEIEAIGAHAFANTKALTTLTIRKLPIEAKLSKSGKVFVRFKKGSSISKKAFAKCGKGGGKGLTFFESRITERREAFLKKKYGLPSAVNVARCK